MKKIPARVATVQGFFALVFAERLYFAALTM
jgi:hypothetical protein